MEITIWMVFFCLTFLTIGFVLGTGTVVAIATLSPTRIGWCRSCGKVPTYLDINDCWIGRRCISCGRTTGVMRTA